MKKVKIQFYPDWQVKIIDFRYGHNVSPGFWAISLGFITISIYPF